MRSPAASPDVAAHAGAAEQGGPFSPAGAERARALAEALENALAAKSPVVLIPLDGRPLHAMVTSRRHEGLHYGLSQLVQGERVVPILANGDEYVQSSPAIERAAQILRAKGYPEPHLADEIFVISAAASGMPWAYLSSKAWMRSPLTWIA